MRDFKLVETQGELRALAADVLAAEAGHERLESLEQVDEICKKHPDVEVHVYEGAQHGFSCDARGSFHPLSAAIALGRTLEFFVANGVKP